MFKGRKRWMSQLRKRLNCPSSAFCSIWAVNELDDAHLYWGGLSALFSSPIQILIFQKHPFRHLQK